MKVITAGFGMSVFIVLVWSVFTSVSLAQGSDNFAGLNFADSFNVEDVNVKIAAAEGDQRGLLIGAKVQNIPTDKLLEGWVSWALVPDSMNISDTQAVREYAFKHFLAFTNQENNILIDDGKFIPDRPSRIVIFSWKCVTSGCDSLEDIPQLEFVSRETINYHVLAVGQRVSLSR